MTNPRFLTESQVEAFLAAAKRTEYPIRDELMYLLAFRHGLRVSELIHLQHSHIYPKEKAIYVKRLKGSLSTMQPLTTRELSLIRRHQETPLCSKEHFFLSERGEPFTRFGINYNVVKIGMRAGLDHVHPHMLRHACGYYLANKGYDTRLIQEYLGHKDINNTVRYTQVNHTRFKGLFDA